MVVFEVFGIAQPKGSTRAFMRPGLRFPVVTSDNPKMKPWAQEISGTALCHKPLGPLWEGPVGLRLHFNLPKPAHHPKRKRRDHLKKPDIDKLTRTVMDALSGIFYVDDRQVVQLQVTKSYGSPPGVVIAVTTQVGVTEEHLALVETCGV